MDWQILSPSEHAKTAAPNELLGKMFDDLLLLVQRGRTSLQGPPSMAPLDLICQVLTVPAAPVIRLTLPASHKSHPKTSLRLVMHCEKCCGLSDADDLADGRLFDRCGSELACALLRLEILWSQT